ncbi:unnamed protein product [Rotaria sordida]|uniref:Uncharacterized protein n=1 Tax=Rotaria sordida TaxID=392033 RepID=A0A819I1F6_9BILA|nr:unnamed protein product [Rotaria sordida]
MDLSQYGNVTWPQRRVPRVIHQTYRTYDIPAIWNRPVQSVMTMNAANENAEEVAKMNSSAEYEIEIAFYFDGFKRTSTSSV